MLRFLQILIFTYSVSVQANIRCENLFTDSDLRYILSSGQLTLTPLRKYHQTQIVAILKDPEVQRFFAGSRSPKEIVSSDLQRAQRKSGGKRETFDGFWAIKYQNQTVGYILLARARPEWIPEQIRSQFEDAGMKHGNFIVGYAMDPNFRGLGLATASLKMTLQFAKDVLHAENVFASVGNQNTPSMGVLEKNGFEPVFTTEKNTKFLKKM